MEKKARLEKDIISLISQLQKLLKVINHSDPTAKDLKHTLYSKYRARLNRSAQQFRYYYHWNDFQREVRRIADENEWNFEFETKEIILRKLFKDFESAFVNRLVLKEFSPPDPQELEKRVQARQRRREIKKEQMAKDTPHTRETIMEMVQMKDQERKAISDLNRIIAAIKRIGPEKLESRITPSERRPRSNKRPTSEKPSR